MMQPVLSKPRQKRSRIYWSCTNCRRSKQKCDTETPCRTCLIRGKQDTCQYEKKAPPPANTMPSVTLPTPAPSNEHVDVLPVNANLSNIGYSQMNSHNSVGILMRLEQYGSGTTKAQVESRSDQFVSLAARSRYAFLLGQLPCNCCVSTLVGHFFDEVNWHNTLLDRNYFDDRLRRFNKDDLVQQGCSSSSSASTLLFPALLFQVLSNALQFTLEPFSPHQNPQCLQTENRQTEIKYSEISTELLLLFKRQAVNLTSILTQFLRVSWLKNRGQVLESWQLLAQVAHDAQEIGLSDPENLDAATFDGRTAGEHAWELHMSHRTMLNIFLWDSQMAVVLGKPMSLNVTECSVSPPIDCDVSADQRGTLPSARRESDTPSTFTLRLLEYPLAQSLCRLRSLEGKNQRKQNYSQAVDLHRQTLEYIKSLPPLYRFDNPDTSWDRRCPWLVAHRHYLRSSIMFFLVVLHRTYLFYIPQSRRALLACGIELLAAQDKFLAALKPIHHTLCSIIYLTVEPCISILAVVTSHPDENSSLVGEALVAVRMATDRLERISHANAMASSARHAVEAMWTRASLEAGRKARAQTGNHVTCRSLASLDIDSISRSGDKALGTLVAPPTSGDEAQREDPGLEEEDYSWMNEGLFTSDLTHFLVDSVLDSPVGALADISDYDLGFNGHLAGQGIAFEFMAQ